MTYFADTVISHSHRSLSTLNTTSTIIVDYASDSLAPTCLFNNEYMSTNSIELQATVSQLYGNSMWEFQVLPYRSGCLPHLTANRRMLSMCILMSKS